MAEVFMAYAGVALLIGASLVGRHRKRLAALGFWRQMAVFTLAPAVLAVDLIRLIFKGGGRCMVDVETLAKAAAANGYRLVAAEETPEYGAKKERPKIASAEDVYKALGLYAYAPVEHFLAVALDGAGRLIRHWVVSKGTVNQTLVHPRDIFRRAIADNAAAVIVAHNHPSGNCFPSEKDRRITRRIQEAGEIVGIELLDHVILTESGWYSFAEEGEL